jgi:hypothetical protein
LPGEATATLRALAELVLWSNAVHLAAAMAC